ncbi:MAG TPA: hypothetical protein VGI63_08600 [Verrucomicrobiae bacterium]
MKKIYLSKIAAAFALATVLLAPSAKATITVNLSTYGIGYVEPTFLGSAWTVVQLNNMISTYNSGSSSAPYTIDKGSATPSPSLTLVSTIGTTTLGSGNPTGNIINLGTGGYSYLSCQWDGPNGGNCVYYIAGLTGQIDLINDLPGRSQYGLSGYELSTGSITTPVPEPSTVVAGVLLLLPFGVSAVRILRKNKLS